MHKMLAIAGVGLGCLLAGCGRSEADGSAPAPAQAAAAPASSAPAAPRQERGFSPTGVEVALVNRAPRRGPSLTDEKVEQWVVELQVTNQGQAALEGLTYALNLVQGEGEGQAFALHAGEIHFTPAVEPGNDGHWTVRLRVADSHPAAGTGARVRWLEAARSSRRPPEDGGWTPLDPDNLPAPKEVSLDKTGNLLQE